MYNIISKKIHFFNEQTSESSGLNYFVIVLHIFKTFSISNLYRTIYNENIHTFGKSAIQGNQRKLSKTYLLAYYHFFTPKNSQDQKQIL